MSQRLDARLTNLSIGLYHMVAKTTGLKPIAYFVAYAAVVIVCILNDVAIAIAILENPNEHEQLQVGDEYE